VKSKETGLLIALSQGNIENREKKFYTSHSNTTATLLGWGAILSLLYYSKNFKIKIY